MWVRPTSAGPPHKCGVPHKCGAPHKRCRPLGGEFLLRFAPLDPGSPRVAFALSRSGRPERLQRNTHSEAFCAMGLDELGKAAGESRYRVRYGARNRDRGCDRGRGTAIWAAIWGGEAR